jgi:hypothetical protein
MQSPAVLRSSPPVSRSGPGVCGTGLAMSGFAPQPIAWVDTSVCVSLLGSPHHAGERVERNPIALSPFPQAFRRSPCLRTGAGHWPLDDGLRGRLGSVPVASRHAVGHRSRLTTAGFHARRRAGCAWSHFFPRSVGFGPTASRASGAFTIEPSMLCHDQAIPSISSYSARPRRHIFTNTPQRFHSRKCACTELALPYSFGRAFHWQPVRSTYTIPSNTLLGGIGFRPPPGRRLYLRPFTRLGLGINVATRSHSRSGTVHDLAALIRHNIVTLHMSQELFTDKF